MTIRMFLAGLLLKSPLSHRTFEALYGDFVSSHFRNIRKFYSPSVVFEQMISNEDGWFILIPAMLVRPGEYDDKCLVGLTTDVTILTAMLQRFEQSKFSVQSTAGPSLLLVLDECIAFLQKRIAPRGSTFEYTSDQLESLHVLNVQYDPSFGQPTTSSFNYLNSNQQPY
ncbi:unnamed protein product [Caenorhabditis sp. 36 PRJEB53466]|nr:unnamed protein product [Caenorhabditis sp. 36 PRJEB53466]